MATVIDALVVTLGLNAKGFTQGVNQAQGALKKTGVVSGQTAREMNAHGKLAAQLFSRVRNEALALLGLFTAGMGLKNFAASTIESASSLGLLASNLDMSIEGLQAWQSASERAGGTAQGMAAQLRQSTLEIARYKRGIAAESVGAFFQFGGNVNDLKDGNSYLLARSRIVSELYKTDRSRAALAAQMMGISDDQFDFIRQGPAAITQMIAAQKKRSSILKEDADNAVKLKNLYLDLRDTFGSVGTKILVAFMPLFQKLIKLAEKWGDKFQKNSGKIVAWIEKFIATISKFARTLDTAAQSVGGWKNVLIGLGGLKILSMLTPLTKLAASLAGVAKSLINIGSTAAAAGIGALSRLAGAAGLFLYHGDLNSGEDESLAVLKDPALGGKKPMEAMRYFEQRGFDRTEASGIVANLMAESNLDPHAVGDGGQALGIAQWHPPRQADFKKVFGKDMRESTLAEQFDFVIWELNNNFASARRALRTTDRPAQAAEVITRQYEKPRDHDGESRRRALVAESLYMNAGIAERQHEADRGVIQSARQASPAALLTSPAIRETSNTTEDRSSQVIINGPVTVTTNATDAQAMARELQRLNDPQSLVLQANTGTY